MANPHAASTAARHAQIVCAGLTPFALSAAKALAAVLITRQHERPVPMPPKDWYPAMPGDSALPDVPFNPGPLDSTVPDTTD